MCDKFDNLCFSIEELNWIKHIGISFENSYYSLNDWFPNYSLCVYFKRIFSCQHCQHEIPAAHFNQLGHLWLLISCPLSFNQSDSGRRTVTFYEWRTIQWRTFFRFVWISLVLKIVTLVRNVRNLEHISPYNNANWQTCPNLCQGSATSYKDHQLLSKYFCKITAASLGENRNLSSWYDLQVPWSDHRLSVVITSCLWLDANRNTWSFWPAWGVLVSEVFILKVYHSFIYGHYFSSRAQWDCRAGAFSCCSPWATRGTVLIGQRLLVTDHNYTPAE
jgi:hypothetical protein